MDMPATKNEIINPAFNLQNRLGHANLPVGACYQCRKCSNGCPLTFAMDLLPDRVIRMALLGQEEQVLGSNTIWVCSSCETCTTRCPNGIDIAGVMDWLKEEALKRGLAVPQKEIAEFHRIFLKTIKASGGRISETALMQRFTLFKLRRKVDVDDLRQNLKLGLGLWKRGRLRLLGHHRLRGQSEIKKIFQSAGV
jgi:heterodisulfide reductase subunit C2